MSKGTYRCLRVPTSICVCLLVSEGDHWYLKVPTGV